MITVFYYRQESVIPVERKVASVLDALEMVSKIKDAMSEILIFQNGKVVAKAKAINEPIQ